MLGIGNFGIDQAARGPLDRLVQGKVRTRCERCRMKRIRAPMHNHCRFPAQIAGTAHFVDARRDTRCIGIGRGEQIAQAARAVSVVVGHARCRGHRAAVFQRPAHRAVVDDFDAGCGRKAIGGPEDCRQTGQRGRFEIAVHTRETVAAQVIPDPKLAIGVGIRH